jgi:hypothetical protein
METREQLEAREDVRAVLDGLRARPDIGTAKLRPIDTAIGVVIVKTPSRGQAAVMMTQIHDDDPGVKSKAMTGLFQMCIVHPAPAEVAKALDEYPLALTEPGAMLEFRRHIGNAREAEAK